MNISKQTVLKENESECEWKKEVILEGSEQDELRKGGEL